jgi:TonB family protein
VNQRPLLIAIALTLANLLSAQELSHTTAPRVIAKVDPVYSDRARLLHLEGDVILRVIVGIDGRMRNPQVISGYVGPDLDQSAIDVVQKWRFAPATKDGQPVEMPAQVEVNFRIPDKAGWRIQQYIWRLGNYSCEPTDGLEIQSVVEPHVAEGAQSATATLSFGISEKGEAYNIRAVKTSSDGWASDVTTALVQWRFTPVECTRSYGSLFTVLFVRGPFDPGAKP